MGIIGTLSSVIALDPQDRGHLFYRSTRQPYAPGFDNPTPTSQSPSGPCAEEEADYVRK